MGHVGKVGCVYPIVIDSILPHMEFGSNDRREDAPHFSVVFMISESRKKCLKYDTAVKIR